MDNLPDQLIWEILSRVEKTVDRNFVSLVCKRIYELDSNQRQSLRFGCGLDPANEALTSLCNRFPNLVKVEISCSGWMSKLGKQLDDQGLKILANKCPPLLDLTLSYCTFVTDVGLRHLAYVLCQAFSIEFEFHTKDHWLWHFGMEALCSACYLESLELVKCQEISDEGLQLVGQFPHLRTLRLRKCFGITDDGLKPLVGSCKLEHMTVEDCPQTSERVVQGAARSVSFRQDLSWMY